MKYLSTFSGIEAATVAWHPLGWQPVGFSEIEPFPCAVLNHHYPNVQNYGDITKFRDWSVEPFQLLVGGSPCQSFSVAGLRKGLADERGNLMLEFGRLAQYYRPTWVVWENVPGVLSSNRGRDFASFLGMLAEFGYGFAYRVLDAQYFGVPQRRRRVFVVGYLGDWRPAAAVLFDPHSLSGHPPPSRKAGEGAAGGVKAGSHWSGGPHPSLNQSNNNSGGIGMSNQEIFSQGGAGLVANTLQTTCHDYSRADGFNMVLQPLAFKVRGGCDGGGKGYLGSEDCAFTLSTGVDQHIAQPMTYDMSQVTSPTNKQNRKPGDPCHTLAKEKASRATVVQPMAFSFDSLSSNSMKSSNPHSGCNQVDVAKTLDTTDPHPSKNQGGMAVVQPMAIQGNLIGRDAGGPQGAGVSTEGPMYTLTKADVHGVVQPMAICLGGQHPNAGIGIDQSPTLTNAMGAGGGHVPITNAMAVRRLTPTECERLQGFPDSYTAIPWKNKPVDQCPDGPRYKALGNSMAVPVMRWIGERIQAVEELMKELGQ